MNVKRDVEDIRKMRVIRQEAKTELMMKQEGKCAVCGKEIQWNNCEIDHIYPYALGGSNEISNLQLVCINCNRSMAGKPFLEHQFEEFMESLLSDHPDYSVCYDYAVWINSDINPDLVIEKMQGNEKQVIIAEVTAESSFTDKRINQRFDVLKKYAQLIDDKKSSNTKVALITPGELPEEYEKLARENKIELWDKNFISKEFKGQLDKAEPEIFKMMISSTGAASTPTDEYQDLIDELKACVPGKSDWGKYQKLVGKILETLFCPPLKTPLPQSNDKEKKNRRDYVLPNYSLENDVWKYVREQYNADYIVVDAKNSAKSIAKDDVLQIANYLKVKGAGLFGIIVSRKGEDKASEHAIRDAWIMDNKMIITLKDADIESMLIEKRNGNNPAELILKKIEDFRLSI